MSFAGWQPQASENLRNFDASPDVNFLEHAAEHVHRLVCAACHDLFGAYRSRRQSIVEAICVGEFVYRLVSDDFDQLFDNAHSDIASDALLIG